MTEKDNVSMATVQMKPDYAASEVYSTASEAPPAYKRQSNSVKIAKIAAFTIVASAFILGAFILASSYLQVRASCDQVQALDSVLEKELMLETLQQVNKELPRAEALLGKETGDEVDLQNLDKDDSVTKVETKHQSNAAAAAAQTTTAANNSDEDDSTYSESEESDDKWPKKVPLELDLSDLAAVILQNNKRSRMNCVVERKHAEEFVDTPSKTVALPFGVNLQTDPKKARITGERISIFCEGGNEHNKGDSNNNNNNNQQQRDEENDETVEDFDPVRAVYLPYQRIPIPFGQIPQQFPLTHMPQRMGPPQMPQMSQLQMQMQMQPPQQPMIRQMPPPFQLPMRPPMPPQIMQAPHPEPQIMQHHMPEPPQQQQQTVRIHVQQIPFREIHVADDIPVQIPAQHQELPHFEIQRMPLFVALQRAGITAEDLSNIKRMAEDRITDELHRLAVDVAAESSNENNNNSSDEDSTDSQSSTQNSSEQQDQQSAQEPQQQLQQQEAQQQQETEPTIIMKQAPPQRLILRPLPDQPRDTMTPPMPDQPQMMQYNRATYGRSLAQPVRIPVPMMPMIPAQGSNADDSSAINPESERPHFVQPRSV